MTKSCVQHRAPVPREAIGLARRGYISAKAVGSFLPALTTKAFQKYGFSAASLITDWPAIAGKDLARYTAPERLKWPRVTEHADDDDGSSRMGRSGATLILRVDGARALNVQYGARQIMERINAYFGYAAVAELRVIQGPVAAPPTRRGTKLPAEPLTQEVAGIGDSGLRDALARLGAEVRAIR